VLLNISLSTMTVAVEGDGSCGATGGGEATVSMIAPDILYRGTVTPVTITGTGFADGMDVSFAGGSGPRPTASEINVVGPTTIEAFVTVKNAGPSVTQDWDVQVGSGTLIDGLTVQP
jgi:predicted secreted protein